MPTRSLVDYGHKLVNMVLLPIHRRHPIISVSLRRDPWGIGTKPAWAEQ